MDLTGIMTVDGMAQLLTAGLGGKWNGVVAGLYTGRSGSYNPFTNMSDLTVATFTGFAELAVVWGPIGELSGGSPYAVCNTTLRWQGPTDLSGQTIVGWYIAVPASVGPPAVPELLLAFGDLPTPLPLLAPTDQLNLTPSVGLQGLAGGSLTV